jgi:signal transduction histidine kinase
MIHVRVYEDQEDAFLEIKVVDSGIGIKKDDQKKLFKLFGFIDKNKDQNT